MKNRLKSYLDGYGHTALIQKYLRKNRVTFRFVKTQNHKMIEAQLIHQFEKEFGELPLLNVVRPKIN
ncbi:MAG: hypothetical protein H8E98_07975 [Bacteroidetes bacterium]|nr:hypothetical protein [Bacteroidota bacterium]